MDENVNLNETLITLTADIVSAHVSNNSVAVNDLPQLIQNVHNALIGRDLSPTPRSRRRSRNRPFLSARR
jgi:predicted transcriptional regulator